MAFSLFAPLLLFTAYVVVAGFAAPSDRPRLHGPGLLIAAAIGAVPLWTARYAALARLGFMLLYVFMYGMLLVLYGTALGCSLFYDCD